MPPKGFKYSKPFTKEHSLKLSISRTGEKNHKWKGERVSYSGLHHWIVRKLGRPDRCAVCDDDGQPHRSYHWANISKTYKRDLSDWIRLCVKCHKAYDMGKINL